MSRVRLTQALRDEYTELFERTRRVPAGRPVTGEPPFDFEDSAVDALQYSGMSRWTDWSLPGTLYRLEAYNGFGYRLYHPDVLSPYLWGRSYHYVRGGYARDGKWSDAGDDPMVRRNNDGGNSFMDFVWGAIFLAVFLIWLFDW